MESFGKRVIGISIDGSAGGKSPYSPGIEEVDFVGKAVFANNVVGLVDVRTQDGGTDSHEVAGMGIIERSVGVEIDVNGSLGKIRVKSPARESIESN